MSYNEWEAKSIESELDKIRAKYLMSPSDYDKNSSMRNTHVNHTGTFKAECDSADTRNQSEDNYGNEVREFVIDHPTNRYNSQSSQNLMNSGSKDVVRSRNYDDKENFVNQNIVVEKPTLRAYDKDLKYADNGKLSQAKYRDMARRIHPTSEDNTERPGTYLLLNDKNRHL